MNRSEKRVAFVLYSDPMIYPPTMNAANILAEQGWKVDIYGIRHCTAESIEYDSNVTISYFDNYKVGFGLKVQYFFFTLWCARSARKQKYRWVFSYDTMGVGPGRCAAWAASAKWCHHSHDMWETSSGVSWHNWLIHQELWFARTADLVSFPQADRAKIFSVKAKLTQEPILVFNGPRKIWGCYLNPHPEILKLKQHCQKIALYQGGLSSDFKLDKLIEALPHCQANVGLCLIGKELEPGIKKSLLEQAKRLDLDQRVLILPVLPYDQLPSVTKHCDIGIAKFTDDTSASVNDFYLAGASNKLAEYMACGLPILAPDTPTNKLFIKDAGYGLLCHVSDPKSVAESIDKLLLDRQGYEKISSNNLLAFEKHYNYDTQFDKVLKILES